RKAAILARFALGTPVAFEAIARRPLAEDPLLREPRAGRLKQRVRFERKQGELTIEVGLARYEPPHPFASLEGGSKGARVETARGGTVTLLGGAGGLAATADVLLSELLP